MPSKTPGAMTSSRLSSSVAKFCRARRGCHVVSFQSSAPADRRGQQIDQVADVVEVFESDHRAFDRGGAVAVGDAVGQGVEFCDQFVVGDGIPGRPVRRDDPGVMDLAVVRGDGQVGAEPLGQRGISQRLVEVHSVVLSISDQMSSESRRAGVNCSGSALPSSSAAAVA